MKAHIRQEEINDHKAVFEVVEKAFREEDISDHSEPFLVERLRNSEAFVPELSLVAVLENTIIGHILLTKATIKDHETEIDTLVLAPVSVVPEYQNKGIGTELIKTVHFIALKIGFTSVFVLGHENYYPRFGYQKADKFGINFPFNAPAENCMAIELVAGSLSGVTGKLEYPKDFFM